MLFSYQGSHKGFHKSPDKNNRFVLRDMALEDLESVLAVEQQCHSHPWKASHFTSSIESSHQCRVVWDGSSIVAYMITSTAADEAELLNITVAPEYQRQGIAIALLDYVCTQFGLSIHTLFLEVRESNLAAIALYDNLGFNQVGKRPNYYPSASPTKNQSSKKNHSGKKTISDREDAIIMARML